MTDHDRNEWLLLAILFCFAFALLVAGCVSPVGPTANIQQYRDCVSRVVSAMPTDEYRALYAGYEVARNARPDLSVVSFVHDQVTLYATATETDPRLLVWFYGDTLNALRACEAR